MKKSISNPFSNHWQSCPRKVANIPPTFTKLCLTKTSQRGKEILGLMDIGTEPVAEKLWFCPIKRGMHRHLRTEYFKARLSPFHPQNQRKLTVTFASTTTYLRPITPSPKSLRPFPWYHPNLSRTRAARSLPPLLHHIPHPPDKNCCPASSSPFWLQLGYIWARCATHQISRTAHAGLAG